METPFVLKQVFLFVLLGLALAGQGIAGPMSCSTRANGDSISVEMVDCSEIDMNDTADTGDKSNDCCGSDCGTMLQCSQTTAAFSGGAAFVGTIVPKAMSHSLGFLGTPTGMHGIPEIKPPIIA